VGTYSVKLTVTDSNGNQRSSWVTAIISDVPPVSIPGNETNATVGEPVTFNGSASYSPDGNIVSYDWYFGDGTNATGAIVTHTYDRPDNYDAMLMVTDDDGINTTAYVTVNVEAAAVSPAVPQADTQTKQGLVLLAGAGIACVILLLVLRKKPK
jgi:chitodextrinase